MLYWMLQNNVCQGQQEYVWDQWLDAWLTAKLQPKLDLMLATENATLRAKVVELRRELDAAEHIQDNLRQQVAVLRETNDSLRKENYMLQM